MDDIKIFLGVLYLKRIKANFRRRVKNNYKLEFYLIQEGRSLEIMEQIPQYGRCAYVMKKRKEEF